MIIYKRKLIPENMKKNGPPGTLYSTPTCHANVIVDVS